MRSKIVWIREGQSRNETNVLSHDGYFNNTLAIGMLFHARRMLCCVEMGSKCTSTPTEEKCQRSRQGVSRGFVLWTCEESSGDDCFVPTTLLSGIKHKRHENDLPFAAYCLNLCNIHDSNTYWELNWSGVPRKKPFGLDLMKFFKMHVTVFLAGGRAFLPTKFLLFCFWKSFPWVWQICARRDER